MMSRMKREVLFNMSERREISTHTLQGAMSHVVRAAWLCSSRAKYAQVRVLC